MQNTFENKEKAMDQNWWESLHGRMMKEIMLLLT
jgi:hypothetical protein